MTLIQTAIEQGWTIGELNKRIKEQSSLKDDKFLDITRGDPFKMEMVCSGNNQYRTGFTKLPSLMPSPHNLTKSKEGYKWQS